MLSTGDSVAAMIRGETLMILAPNPGDETSGCGGLIAQCCSWGRPPFVMMLGDGAASQPDAAALGVRRERQGRAAMQCLGLPSERLLLAGLFEGTIPDAGVVFDAVVKAVTLVMWARDCNVVCAPGLDSATPDDRATGRVAAAVAAGSGVGSLVFGEGAGWRLDISAHLAAKRAALAAYDRAGDIQPFEVLAHAG